MTYRGRIPPLNWALPNPSRSKEQRGELGDCFVWTASRERIADTHRVPIENYLFLRLVSRGLHAVHRVVRASVIDLQMCYVVKVQAEQCLYISTDGKSRATRRSRTFACVGGASRGATGSIELLVKFEQWVSSPCVDCRVIYLSWYSGATEFGKGDGQEKECG